MAVETPVVVFMVEPGEAWLDVIIDNPPTGTPAVENEIERRAAGTSAWTRVAVITSGSRWRDHTGASGAGYEYRVRAVPSTGPGAYSKTLKVTAPVLTGSWIHAALAPAATIRTFPYLAGDRTESLGVELTGFQLLGRARPVYESSEFETLELALSYTIPFGADHDAAVQWWRDCVRARAVVLYRDGRGRREYGVFGEAQIADARSGSTVTAKLMAADFTEAV
jgi:hypothetical protein